MDPPLRERIRLRDSTWGGEAPGVRARTARTGALFCLLGALFGLISAVTPDAAVHDEDLLVIVSVLAAALALALVVDRRPHARRRVPRGRRARHGAGERRRVRLGHGPRLPAAPVPLGHDLRLLLLPAAPGAGAHGPDRGGLRDRALARGHRPHAGGRLAGVGGHAGDRRARGGAAPRPARRHDRAPRPVRQPRPAHRASEPPRLRGRASTSSWSGPGAATLRSASWWPTWTASRA